MNMNVRSNAAFTPGHMSPGNMYPGRAICIRIHICRRKHVTGYMLLVQDTCRQYLGDIITIHFVTVDLWPAGLPEGQLCRYCFTHGSIFRFSPHRGDSLRRSRWNLGGKSGPYRFLTRHFSLLLNLWHDAVSLMMSPTSNNWTTETIQWTMSQYWCLSSIKFN